mgnify:CR=1 FL=1
MVRTWALAAFLLVAALAAPSAGQDFPLQRFNPTRAELERAGFDEWYGAYRRGEKCGYARIRAGEQEGVFRFEKIYRWKLVAMGSKVDALVRERYTFDLTAPYALRSARMLRRQGDEQLEVEAERKGQQFMVTTINRQGRSKRLRKLIPYTYVDAVARTFLVRLKLGDALRLLTFDPDKWQLGAPTYRLADTKTIKRRGVPTRIYRCKILAGTEQSLAGEGVYDERGVILKEDLYGLFQLRAEPEELAKQADYSGDLYEAGKAKIDKPLGDPRTVRKLVLQVGGKGRKRLASFGPQRVWVEEGKTYVEVDVEQEGPRVTPDERRAALAATAEIQAKHPRVRALAEQATRGTHNRGQRVAALVHFVSQYVADAYGRNAMTCLEVIDNKQGDCTEHSTLFAGLCRALGIPCRRVYGVAYLSDEELAFGGHAWNEVELEGRWVAVDATWDEELADATHIRFGNQSGDFGRLLGTIKFRRVSRR